MFTLKKLIKLKKNRIFKFYDLLLDTRYSTVCTQNMKSLTYAVLINGLCDGQIDKEYRRKGFRQKKEILKITIHTNHFCFNLIQNLYKNIFFTNITNHCSTKNKFYRFFTVHFWWQFRTIYLLQIQFKKIHFLHDWHNLDGALFYWSNELSSKIIIERTSREILSDSHFDTFFFYS